VAQNFMLQFPDVVKTLTNYTWTNVETGVVTVLPEMYVLNYDNMVPHIWDGIINLNARLIGNVTSIDANILSLQASNIYLSETVEVLSATVSANVASIATLTTEVAALQNLVAALQRSVALLAHSSSR